MNTLTLRPAGPEDAPEIARLAAALLGEIMTRTGAPNFKADAARNAGVCRELLAGGELTALLLERDGLAAGYALLCQSASLYAGGRFGILQELYVEPGLRSGGAGERLLAAAMEHGRGRGWLRLELCTPPLPEFDGSLRFYERHGFEITGGRKMKRLLHRGGA